METLLLVTILLPLVGAVLTDGSRGWARGTALVTTALTFVLAVILIGQSAVTFLPPDAAAGTELAAGAVAPGEFVVLKDLSRLGLSGGPAGIRFSIGLDGLGVWLFGLTALLLVVAVLVSWEAIRQRTGAYYRLLLLVETGMLGVFVARDVILFFVFLEFTLIPLFFLIGVWGGDQRRYAAIKFFLFTLAGNSLTLLGLLAIVAWSYSRTGTMTFSIPELTASLAHDPIGRGAQIAVFLALAAGFAVQVPLFPLHTWLPLVHVEAPTAASVILAGVLLKVGGYGFVRFCLPMLPDATAVLMPWLLWLSVAGIIYGALVALVQTDIKRLIAYAGISQVGFCMLGVFSLTPLGIRGGVLQMISHGLAAGGLFAVVGMLDRRYHTRQIKDLGGLARKTPVLAFFMLLLAFSSIGLPGLAGFSGEFLLLLGVFQRARLGSPLHPNAPLLAIAVLAAAGAVLGAWAMLRLVHRVFFGVLREPKPKPAAIHPRQTHPAADLAPGEILALTSLSVFIFWIGIQPGFFLDRMGPTLGGASDSTTTSFPRSAWERTAGTLRVPEAELVPKQPVPLPPRRRASVHCVTTQSVVTRKEGQILANSATNRPPSIAGELTRVE